MKTNFRISNLVFLMLFLSQGFAQPRIIGNSDPNLFSVVKTYPTGVYAIGSITLNGIPHATFSKFSPGGHEVWTVRISERSQFTDFVQTDNGGFLLVGLEPPFDANSKSLTAHITDFGVVSSVFLHDFGVREAFNRVIRNPKPTNPDYPYLILGVRNQPSSSTLDYTVLSTAHSSGLLGAVTRVESLNSDIQLNLSLKPISTGGFAICGDVSGSGQITFLNGQMNVTGGWRPNGINVSFISDFIELSSPQKIIWIGRTSSNEAIIGRSNISNGNIDWVYKIPSSLGVSTNFLRIIEAAGHYYFTMSLSLPSSSTGYAVAKITDNSISATLDWIKLFDDGSINFTGPNICENTITNGLVYTDGRSGNPNGFGLMDGFIATTNYDLLSCKTKTSSGLSLLPASINPDDFLVSSVSDSKPNPTTLPGLLINYNEAELCGINPIEIEPKSPKGSIEYQVRDSIEYLWTALETYSGTYRLKILKMKLGETPPDILSETGLFFDQKGIIGTRFKYSSLFPAYDTTYQYAWQIETDEQLNGETIRGPIAIWHPIPPIQKEMMWITSVLPKEVCPGDCFTVTGKWRPNTTSFSGPWYLKLMSVYTLNPSDIMIIQNGLDPVPNATPNSLTTYNISPFPDNIATLSFGSTFTFDVCVNPNAVGPILLKFYANLFTQACVNNQTGAGCLFAEVNHTFNVIQPSFIPPPNFTIQNFSGLALNEICNGEAVKFVMPMPLPSSPNVSVTWEYSNNANGPWTTLTDPVFNSNNPTTFTVKPGVLSINCANNVLGYEDKFYRAKIKVSGTLITAPSTVPATCTYYSTIYPLRICCKLSPASITVTPNLQTPSGPLCEGDPYSYIVSLNTPDAFVPNPPSSTITWTSSEFGPGMFPNQLSFPVSGIAGPNNIQFTATITNCANKSQTVSACIEVSKKPICPTIIGNWPTMTPITVQNTLASNSYLICPGDDAALEVVTPGQNCIIHWEYTDNPANPDNLWIDVGSPFPASSNSSQNTNILLPTGWTAPCIYYRVKCEPLPLTGSCGPITATHPCKPCYSNIIEICLWPPPQKPVIDGSLPICKGQNVTLSVLNPVAGETYCWFWNGKDIGTGISETVSDPGNYWVVAKGKCQSVASDWFNLVVCCTDAKISCPLAPNLCAHTDEPICFLGLGATLCGSIVNYEWSVNGVSMQSSSSDQFCVPAGWLSPMIVMLVVTDSNGCTADYTIKVVACE